MTLEVFKDDSDSVVVFSDKGVFGRVNGDWVKEVPFSSEELYNSFSRVDDILSADALAREGFKALSL